jgi:hypothetical protein
MIDKELQNKHGKPYLRTELVATKYLPSLDGLTYESFENNPNQDNSNNYFDRETKLIFKRARLNFAVMKFSRDISFKVMHD